MCDQRLLDREYVRLCECLIEHRDRLMQRVGSNSTASELEPGCLADQLDRATRIEHSEIRLRLRDAERVTLAEVTRALEKFYAGTYGLCEGTGEPIDIARLRACPWARYSLVYQEMLDDARRSGRR